MIVCPPVTVSGTSSLTLSRFVLFFVRGHPHASIQEFVALISFQIGLAIYSGLLTTIIYKHGGNHEWDMTKADVVVILYV